MKVMNLKNDARLSCYLVHENNRAVFINFIATSNGVGVGLVIVISRKA